MRFVDTNVLLYAISTDTAERGNAARANAIIDAGDIGLSQVLQEFHAQATRPSRADAIPMSRRPGWSSHGVGSRSRRPRSR